MPTVSIIKGDDGKAVGLTVKEEAKFVKFRKRLLELTDEEALIFTWKEPRSGPFHRRHFAMVNALFEAQERFEDDYGFRKWLEMGAGYCDMVPGRDGQLIPVPRSIDYATLDQADFEPIHNDIFKFVRSEYARQTLWAHLDNEKSWQMVDAVLGGFE